ncbi:MAG: radical SAM family heme chaperone HemW [Anaerolineae bacterium]
MSDTTVEPRFAGLYLHMPFCKSKCAYCDFVSYPGLESSWKMYIDCICQELELRMSSWPQVTFDTLYVGGGTPTVIPVSWLAELITRVLACVAHTEATEVTVEANPGTVTASDLSELHRAGVNRLSIGIQSWQSEELTVLGRTHSPEQALYAIQAARATGFTNINLDLMYGLPGQTMDSWRKSLQRTLMLEPEHLALYALTLDTATPLAQRVASGAVALPDDDTYADMYELAIELCDHAGYAHYELSNWALQSDGGTSSSAQPHYASRHNLHYWHNERYLGLGAAAFSYDGVRRWGNTPQVSEYIDTINAGRLPESESETLPIKAAMGETIMLNLRLIKGLIWDVFTQRFQADARDLYRDEIAALVDQGLLVVDDMGMRLSQRALFIANRVLSEFV